MRSLAIEDRHDPTEAGFTGLGFIADDCSPSATPSVSPHCDI